MQHVLHLLLRWYRQCIEPELLDDLLSKYPTPGQILQVLGFIYEVTYQLPRGRIFLCFKEEVYLFLRLTKRTYVVYTGRCRLVSNSFAQDFDCFYSILGFHNDFYTRMRQLSLGSSKFTWMCLWLIPLAFSSWCQFGMVMLVVGIGLVYGYHRKLSRMSAIFNEYEQGLYESYIRTQFKEIVLKVSQMALLGFSLKYESSGSWMVLLAFLPSEYVFYFAIFAYLYHPLPAMFLLLVKYPYTKARLPLHLIYRYLYDGLSIDHLSIHHVVLEQGVYLLEGIATDFKINNVSFLNPAFIAYHKDIYYVHDYSFHSEMMDLGSFQDYLAAIERPELMTYALHGHECQGEIAEIMMFYECSVCQKKLIYVNAPFVHVSLETLQKIIDYLRTKETIVVIYMPQHYFVENLESCDIITPEMR